MKKLFGKIRLTRKMLWIFIGVCVVCNATGAAAVFIGRDRLIGPSYADLNGLSCMEVGSVDIHHKDQVWVRKYVSVDHADGVNRIKTALRVAKAVADSRKVDLVQVVVLDKNGPTDRSGIRGHAIGADVVYIRDPKALPSGVNRPKLTARYVDAKATINGDFYGTTVNLPTNNAAAIMAKMTDKVECEKPVPVLPEGELKAKASEGEKAAPAESAHGGEGGADAKPAGEHGTEAATPAPAEEKPGMIASIKSMIFGAEEKPATDAHGDAQPAVPNIEGPKAEAQPNSHSGEASAKKPEDHATPEPVTKPAEIVATVEPVVDNSVLTSVKSMIFGGKKSEENSKPVVVDQKSH
ncbi:hypothetical protein FB480_1106 [Agrobacterium vitis]|nr:hypothetical protein FB480_1106 [Agrobacterium vitis]